MTPQPMRLVLDANVLYSETLTDVFLALAAAHLVTVVWSDRLREEWQLALARKRPDIAQHRIAARQQQLETAPNWILLAIDDAVVAPLELPDRNDRHVLAAALQSAAPTIITANLRDFPRQTLDVYGVRAVTADAVVCGLLESDPERATALLRPGNGDIATYLEQLRRAGLARAVKRLRGTFA